MNVLFSEQNEASCFRFLSLDHLSIKQNHCDIISSGIKKLEELLSKAEKEEKEIRANMETLFHKNKLKAWATEQHQYTKTVLEQIGDLKTNLHDTLERLLKAKQIFDQVFKGMPLLNKKSITSRKQKENKRKVRKRKKKRLNKIQEEIKQKIIKVDSHTDAEREDTSIVTKEMLHLNELDQLRAHRHKAGLLALLKNRHPQCVHASTFMITCYGPVICSMQVAC